MDAAHINAHLARHVHHPIKQVADDLVTIGGHADGLSGIVVFHVVPTIDKLHARGEVRTDGHAGADAEVVIRNRQGKQQ